MLTVYLAGKMAGRRNIDVLQERQAAARACIWAGLEPWDPAANEALESNAEPIPTNLDYLTMKNYVAKDKWRVLHSDILLVLTGDDTSEGTAWEMGWAEAAGIPIVMVAPLRCSRRLMGFSNVLADAIFSTVEDAVEFIAENYGGVKLCLK